MFVHIFYKGEFIKTLKIGKNQKEMILGRDEENDISFSFDSHISRNHAKIMLGTEDIGIEDLESKNGVFIDGKRVNRVQVPFEKRIYLGDSSLVVSRDSFKEVKKTVMLDKKIFEKMQSSIEGTDADRALSFLYRISTKLGQYGEEKTMIDDLFEELFETFHPGRVILFDIIKKGKDVSVKRLMDAKFIDERKVFSRSVVIDVLKTREAAFIQNVMKEIPDAGKSIRTLGVSSLIAVPLITGKEMLGILQLEFFQSQKTFQEQDFYIICVLSQMISGFLKGIRTIGKVKKENVFYKAQLTQSMEIIGEDKKTNKLKTLISQVARTNTTVLITGESGTGKELVARAIHFESKRKERPFIIINCAAIPGNLIESELFGHVKGAFTGADKARTGKLEAANGGTVFLDEIGDMNMELQTRLLRFLESGEIQPVGSNETKYSDVRIITATNRNLKKSVKEESFRKDLYFRVSVFHLECPALRERGKDIIRIAYYYLNKFSTSMGKSMVSISPDAEKILLSYPWPGNIRELKNIIERACVVGSGEELTLSFLPDEIREQKRDMISLFESELGFYTLSEVEKNYILKVLKEQGGNKAKTAHVLNITRKTLYSKLKEYGIHG